MKKLVEIAVSPADAQNWEIITQTTRNLLNTNELERLKTIRLYRRSIDARARNIVFRLQMEVFLDALPAAEPPILSSYQNVAQNPPVIIVGAGPAGYFAALELIEQGLRPIILERGKEDRKSVV